jgi:hypothetical protein
MTTQIPAQPNPGSEAETVPAKKAPVKKATAKKAVPPTGAKKTAAKKTATRTGPRPAPVASVPDKPEVEEWPPREWRETTRAAGHRQALYVTLSIVAMFLILTLVNIWGSKQG